MNYFELFEIPISLKPDMNIVKKKFFELSRKFHPDFYTNASEEEQAEALEKSALLNKALKIFSSDEETIKYVLIGKNLMEEEEKYQLDNFFLMNVMELNEALMDAKMEGDEAKLETLKSSITQLQQEIYEPIKNIVEHYKEDITTQEELLQVKEYYYQKKYLARILESLK